MGRLTNILIVLFVFSIPWEDLIVIDGFGTFSRFFGFSAIFFGFIFAISENKIKWSLFFTASLLFVIFAWGSLFWSLETDLAVRRVFTYTQLFVVSLLIYQMVDNVLIFKLFSAYVFGAYVSVIATLVAFNTGLEVAYQRFSAEGFDPNDLAFYIVMAIPFSAYLFFQRKKGALSWAYVTYIPLALVSVVLTGSRSGFIAATVAVLYVSYLILSRMSPRLFISAVLLLLCFVFMVYQYIPIDSYERILTIGDELKEGTLSDRTIIWNYGLDAFLSKFVIGSGVGNFSKVIESYTGYQISPHNVFVSISVELGLIGTALWAGMIFSSIGVAFDKKSSLRYLFLAQWVILLFAFLSLNFEWRKLTWVFMVFSLACTQGLDRSKRKFLSND